MLYDRCPTSFVLWERNVIGENTGGSLSCGKVGAGYLYFGWSGGISSDCYKPVKETATNNFTFFLISFIWHHR